MNAGAGITIEAAWDPINVPRTVTCKSLLGRSSGNIGGIQMLRPTLIDQRLKSAVKEGEQC